MELVVAGVCGVFLVVLIVLFRRENKRLDKRVSRIVSAPPTIRERRKSANPHAYTTPSYSRDSYTQHLLDDGPSDTDRGFSSGFDFGDDDGGSGFDFGGGDSGGGGASDDF